MIQGFSEARKQRIIEFLIGTNDPNNAFNPHFAHLLHTFMNFNSIFPLVSDACLDALSNRSYHFSSIPKCLQKLPFLPMEKMAILTHEYPSIHLEITLLSQFLRSTESRKLIFSLKRSSQDFFQKSIKRLESEYNPVLAFLCTEIAKSLPHLPLVHFLQNIFSASHFQKTLSQFLRGRRPEKNYARYLFLNLPLITIVCKGGSLGLEKLVKPFFYLLSLHLLVPYREDTSEGTKRWVDIGNFHLHFLLPALFIFVQDQDKLTLFHLLLSIRPTTLQYRILSELVYGTGRIKSVEGIETKFARFLFRHIMMNNIGEGEEWILTGLRRSVHSLKIHPVEIVAFAVSTLHRPQNDSWIGTLLPLLKNTSKLSEHTLNQVVTNILSPPFLSCLYEEDNKTRKEEALRILKYIYQLNINVLSPRHLPTFLSLYNATTSPSDRIILQILQLYESCSISVFKAGFIWGNKRREYLKFTSELNDHQCSQILWRGKDPLLTYSNISQATCHFPFRREMKEVEGEMHAEPYVLDPAFLLPLLLHEIDHLPWEDKKLTKAIIAYLIVACSSYSQQVRNLSKHILTTEPNAGRNVMRWVKKTKERISIPQTMTYAHLFLSPTKECDPSMKRAYREEYHLDYPLSFFSTTLDWERGWSQTTSTSLLFFTRSIMTREAAEDYFQTGAFDHLRHLYDTLRNQDKKMKTYREQVMNSIVHLLGLVPDLMLRSSSDLHWFSTSIHARHVEFKWRKRIFIALCSALSRLPPSQHLIESICNLVSSMILLIYKFGATRLKSGIWEDMANLLHSLSSTYPKWRHTFELDAILKVLSEIGEKDKGKVILRLILPLISHTSVLPTSVKEFENILALFSQFPMHGMEETFTSQYQNLLCWILFIPPTTMKVMWEGKKAIYNLLVAYRLPFGVELIKILNAIFLKLFQINPKNTPWNQKIDKKWQEQKQKKNKIKKETEESIHLALSTIIQSAFTK